MTRVLSLSTALVVVAGSALGDIHYGDGVVKPRSFRDAYAQAFTVGGGGRSEHVSTDGNEDFLVYATASSDDDGGGITFPQYAFARAYHESTLHSDAMRFTMWAFGSHNGFFGDHGFSTTLDVWFHLSESTPYYFFFGELSRPDLANDAVITREDGTLVPLGFNDAMTFASGTLEAGWHHARLSIDSDAFGGPMYGLIGVPNSASLSLLALGAWRFGTRRRRLAAPSSPSGHRRTRASP